jgi:hypothetical protein
VDWVAHTTATTPRSHFRLPTFIVSAETLKPWRSGSRNAPQRGGIPGYATSLNPVTYFCKSRTSRQGASTMTMSAERFDRWVQHLDRRVPRRGVGGIILAASILLTSASSGQTRKKKKRKKRPQACAARCAGGCCISEFGECVLPAQQGGARCGSRGEPCRACDSDECRPLGGVCDVDAECCDDGANVLVCRDQQCCKPIVQPCTTAQVCCSQLVCARSNLDPELLCRGTWGSPCTAEVAHCMEHTICRGGRCCAPLNQPCETDANCCTNVGGELCRVVPGYLPDNVCCYPSGTFCFGIGENSACCSGTCGEDQKCT